MKGLTWPQAAVVGLIVAALVIVTVTGKDTSGIVLIGGGILAGLGLVVGKTDQVARQTNGADTAKLALIERQSEMLTELAHRLGDMQPGPKVVEPAVEDIHPISPAAP